MVREPADERQPKCACTWYYKINVYEHFLFWFFIIIKHSCVSPSQNFKHFQIVRFWNHKCFKMKVHEQAMNTNQISKEQSLNHTCKSLVYTIWSLHNDKLHFDENTKLENWNFKTPTWWREPPTTLKLYTTQIHFTTSSNSQCNIVG